MRQVLVVGLGGDIGTYAFQRAAHERFGWPSLVVGPRVTTFGRHSTLARWIIEPDIFTPETLLARLDAIAAEHPDHDLLLFTNLDWHVRVLAEHRERLDPRWIVPFPSLAAFDLVSSKVAFAQACDQVGIRTPFTVAVSFGDAAAVGPADAVAQLRERDLAYPLIGKPSNSADWFAIEFPGKQKIHHFESEAELVDVLAHLEERGYPSEFLVQEFVPGDETHMRSLTAYRDRAGQVTLVAGGQVLLEEHTPGTLGIPAAILTGVDREAFDQAARLLDHIAYEGFANFDYKVSSRTGEKVFFEANPRIGRNNFYVTASGVNVAEVLARDLLPAHVDGAPAPLSPERDVLYSVVPYRFLLRYLLDPGLRARVRTAKRRHGVHHPLRYRGDASLKRRLWVRSVDLRLVSKYLQHYPRPTESGF
ncbi:carboxylate--amine ligase [Demequina lignilytica]|uniref:Carboxylate--amine ligase n=1 Tax=Demequina lignilytica TaxID=3051663 RepID=A0AAW7M2A7_9MICO|nr:MULTISPECIES: carboxylate--amine ligase [unclassified Demequina]MDN4477840.1 carboxylate--amine ligase [Demequina sp. SYSU T00039-1]MDN4483479.1 carboxylate--amine ligase [Demequina sp. SYSU T0a273]MDN4487749.1 carboxylate--amine ligase [Demequina sp. SYSU T00039]MDN4490868.1 carboxylate--amine ligase [Demequina sp. SYSU T00068]